MICLHGNHLVVTTKKWNGCYDMVQDVYTVHQVFCDMGCLGIQSQVQKVG